MRFTLYQSLGEAGIHFLALVKEQEEDRMLFARVEHSGCEGCYVEVAKWNDVARQHQRYAFLKFDDKHDPAAAEMAKSINDVMGYEIPLIHAMPNYSA